MSSYKIPKSREWYLVENSVSGWDRQKPMGQHPFIVVRELLGQVVVLGRTGMYAAYDGYQQEAHDLCCGSKTCKIDKKGVIRGGVGSVVTVSDLGEFSCSEPDDQCWDWVLDQKYSAASKRSRK